MHQRRTPRLLQLPTLVICSDYGREKGGHQTQSGSIFNYAAFTLQGLQWKISPLFSGMLSRCCCQPVSLDWDLSFCSVTSNKNGYGIKPLIQIFPQITRKVKSGLKLATSGPLLCCKLFLLKVVYWRLIPRHTTDLIKPPAVQSYKYYYKYSWSSCK